MSDLNLASELALVLRRFEEAGFKYALCGGLAVAIYGYPRFTKDLDFIVPIATVEAAKKAAVAAGYFIDNGVLPFPKSRFDVYRVGKIVARDVVPLDLLMLPDDDPMFGNVRRARFEDIEFNLIALDDLISLKEEANRDNDRIDVARLREIHGKL